MLELFVALTLAIGTTWCIFEFLSMLSPIKTRAVEVHFAVGEIPFDFVMHCPCLSYKMLVQANIDQFFIVADPSEPLSAYDDFETWAEETFRDLSETQVPKFQEAMQLVVMKRRPEWYPRLQEIGLAA